MMALMLGCFSPLTTFMALTISTSRNCTGWIDIIHGQHSVMDSSSSVSLAPLCTQTFTLHGRMRICSGHQARRAPGGRQLATAISFVNKSRGEEEGET
jgi:hypothetical protein